jgi:hypothetical protein
VTVMVDELFVWPGRKPRCFARGSCHLTTDGELYELHALAACIGLKREWFQDHRIPHYDLTAARREAALAAGAVFVPAKEQARRRIAARFGHG